MACLSVVLFLRPHVGRPADDSVILPRLAAVVSREGRLSLSYEWPICLLCATATVCVHTKYRILTSVVEMWCPCVLTFSLVRRLTCFLWKSLLLSRSTCGRFFIALSGFLDEPPVLTWSQASLSGFLDKPPARTLPGTSLHFVRHRLVHSAFIPLLADFRRMLA